MPEPPAKPRQRRRKYNRARLRHLLLTAGPNRLTRGRFSRRHLAQEVILTEIEIASPQWNADFDGLRIAHVSDFHLGELLPLERALSIVQQVHDADPDIVACTGDVVDLHHHGAEPVFEALHAIDAPLGAVMVLGNHDELHCGDTLAAMAEEAGVRVLRNETIERAGDTGALRIGGIDWARTGRECHALVQDTCRAGAVDLLLAHNPKAFKAASAHHIPLTLSGHTHGGHLAMKHRPNVNLAVAHRRSVGLFEHGHSRLYVTTGIGDWFPLRVNCPPEIALITMRKA